METSSHQIKKYRKILFILGMVMAAAVILYAIYGFFDEMNRNFFAGTNEIIVGLVSKILAGLFLSGIMASPYLIGWSLIDKTKYPLYFFIGCIATFPVYIYLITKIIISPGTSSTDVVAVPFYGFFATLLVLILWGICKIADQFKKAL